MSSRSVHREVDGEPVKKATVGGVPSEGMLCDAPMLGWKGGGADCAALLPDDAHSFAPGDAPPPERPRLDKAKNPAAARWRRATPPPRRSLS